MADPSMDRHQSGGGTTVNRETRHEESDVNVRALVLFVVVFVVFAALTHAALFLLYKFYVQIGKGSAANAPMTWVAQSPDANVPASPRLQPFPMRNPQSQVMPPTTATPVVDMKEMRAQEDQTLNTYGYVDRDHGIVHIPIEVAKKMALDSGVYKSASVPAVPPGHTEVILGGQRTAQPSAPAAAAASPQRTQR